MMDLTGKTLGNYQIIEEIGRGGMARVYRAYQPSLNRYVAIKVLPPQLAMDQQFVDRFVREARSAASLRHPHIVIVHDVGEQDGFYYMVMEYLTGQTLRQLIKREGPLPPARLARILEQTASALDYAHQQGFVHRDVKPSNIFVGDGDRVTLTDFGIAKAATEAQQLTRTGMLMGTPEYMSPEQAEGRTVDYRTDLYALGVVLYHMITGQVPFQGTTPHATLHAVIYEPPPPPRQINPSLPPAVESVVLKSIAKQPEERFQRGAAMVKALGDAFGGKAVPFAASPTPPRTPRRGSEPVPPPTSRRSPVVWIMAALAVVLLLLLGGLALIILGEGSGDRQTTATDSPVALVTETDEAGGLDPTPGTPTASAPPGTEQAGPTSTPTEPTETPTTTTVPIETALPSTSTPQPPSATPVPPTNTPKPPTATPTPQPPTTTPTSTPTPTPVPACAFDAAGEFAGLWQSYKNQLGCPIYQHPKLIQDAEQAFQNGHMFWRQDNDYAYVVYELGGLSGSHQSYTGMWSAGDPNYSCVASPPAGLVQPVRGFGAVWCSLGAETAAIGWGLGEEAGFWAGNGDPLVQDFEHGMIYRDSDGTTNHKAYVFFWDSGKFTRVGY